MRIFQILLVHSSDATLFHFSLRSRSVSRSKSRLLEIVPDPQRKNLIHSRVFSRILTEVLAKVETFVVLYGLAIK